MFWLKRIRRRLGVLFWRGSVERDMDREMRAHLAIEEEVNLHMGMSPDEARRAALLSFGGVERFKEQARDERGGRVLEDLLRDVRVGFRALRKRPQFTAVAILTLGLGIGGATTVFSVVDGVLIRNLPFSRAGELVTVWRSSPTWDNPLLFEWRQFLELRDHGRAFSAVAVHRPERMILTGAGPAVSFVGGVASASLFSTLGVRPQLGRFFHERETGPGAARVAILSDEIWRTRFGSEPTVIGKRVTVNEVSYEVIGVLPAGFRLRSRPGNSEVESGVDTGRKDVWLPVGFDGTDAKPDVFTLGGKRIEAWRTNLELVGRVRSGVTREQALAEATSILQPSRRPSKVRVNLASIKEDETASVRSPLLLLMGAAGILLLIACANVANLALSETVGRRREFQTRMALGASRLRIVQLSLVESLLLGLGGSSLGIVLAVVGVHLAVTAGPYLPGLENVRVDGGVLLFATCAGLLTAIIFGLAPAVRGARSVPGIPRGQGEGHEGRRLQPCISVSVFAMTTVLLVTGGLLARSFWNLTRLDRGFRADHLATIRLPILPERYDAPKSRSAFLASVLGKIETIPGVIRASGADNLPYPGARSGHRISRAGDTEVLETPLRRVMAGYHEVAGIPVRAGRGFRETDAEGAPPVAIISEAAARRLWPRKSAIGEVVQHNVYGKLTIVGVVGDVVEGWVGTRSRPMIYLPLAQTSQNEISFIARTAGDPAPIIPLMREAVWAVNPDVAVTMEATMESLVSDTSVNERFRALLVGLFGISATLLAAAGVFGITVRSIARRVRELGIRLALGADRRRLVRMVLRESLSHAVLGTALGLVGACWVSRVLAVFLFGVEPVDPITWATVAALLIVVCLTAGYVPTRRIVRLDPMRVLRVE